MSLWNKILIGLIFVVGVTFFYMAARTLKTHQYWRERARILNEKIDDLDEKNDALVNADPEEGEVDENDDPIQPGIKKLRFDLHKLLLDRGRAWYNCARESVQPTGEVTVKTDLPNPHLIKPKTTLFLFEEKNITDKDAPNNAAYLGEFIVTGVDERMVAMRPARKMNPEELALLGRSSDSWRMYDVMPIDTRNVFSTLDDEEKTALLPGSTIREYLKDGKPAEPDDPVDRVADGKFHRLLRDYKVLFASYHRRQVILEDKKAVNEQDWQYVKNTYEDAIEQRTFREAEVAAKKADLARIGGETTAITGLENSLRGRIYQMQVAIADLAKKNREAAARIAQIQAAAAARINARTSAMAVSSGQSSGQ